MDTCSILGERVGLRSGHVKGNRRMNVKTRQQVQRKYTGAGAETYDEIRLEDPRGALLSRHDLRLFLTMFPSTPGDLKVLEVGAGTGRYTIPVLERGFSLVATDINEPMLGHLRDKIGRLGLEEKCEVRVEDVFKLSSPDNSFDCVFGFHLFPRLLTLEDQRAALIETGRVIKPGGSLFFNYRNAKSLYGHFHKGHMATPKEIESILSEAGLRIVRKRGKWLLSKRTILALPMFTNRALAVADRALWSFHPDRAWDVFLHARKHG